MGFVCIKDTGIARDTKIVGPKPGLFLPIHDKTGRYTAKRNQMGPIATLVTGKKKNQGRCVDFTLERGKQSANTTS